MSKLTSIVKPLAPVGRYYLAHQNIILPVGQVGLSVANGWIIFRNAPKIQQIIADARTFVAQAKDKEEINNIYKQTMKELTPLVLPIILLTAGQVILAVQSKKAMDLKDKKIGELSDALAVANNAIVSYQAFQREAEEKLGTRKVEEIKEEVAKNVIKDNPETKENSMKNCTSANANEVYHYFDTFGQRYFWSTLSPSAIKQKVNDLSIKFSKGEWNQYSDDGSARVTINDIYELIDPNLMIHPAGDSYGWIDEAVKFHDVDEDVIKVWVSGVEDPSNPDNLVWMLDIEGAPLFRTRY